MSLAYESEHQTRKKRVDTALVDQGWQIVPFVEGKPLAAYERCAIEEFQTSNGTADYSSIAARSPPRLSTPSRRQNADFLNENALAPAI